MTSATRRGMMRIFVALLLCTFLPESCLSFGFGRSGRKDKDPPASAPTNFIVLLQLQKEPQGTFHEEGIFSLDKALISPCSGGTVLFLNKEKSGHLGFCKPYDEGDRAKSFALTQPATELSSKLTGRRFFPTITLVDENRNDIRVHEFEYGYKIAYRNCQQIFVDVAQNNVVFKLLPGHNDSIKPTNVPIAFEQNENANLVRIVIYPLSEAEKILREPTIVRVKQALERYHLKAIASLFFEFFQKLMVVFYEAFVDVADDMESSTPGAQERSSVKTELL